jgi:hypothetical protein
MFYEIDPIGVVNCILQFYVVITALGLVSRYIGKRFLTKTVDSSRKKIISYQNENMQRRISKGCNSLLKASIVLFEDGLASQKFATILVQSVN